MKLSVNHERRPNTRLIRAQAVRFISILSIFVMGFALPSCSSLTIHPIIPLTTEVATFTPFVMPTVDPSATGPATQVASSAITHAVPTTETPVPTQTGIPDPSTPTMTIAPASTRDAPILYYTQAGDTLVAVAARFNVKTSEIISPNPLPEETKLIDPKVLLLIPHRLDETSSANPIIPDSEIVYSPSALDLNLDKFVAKAGGYLSTYKEWRGYGWLNGPQTILQVASENSVNPRLLTLLIEYQSHWVYGQPANLAQKDFPMGYVHDLDGRSGLYYQLTWAVQQLNIGYYGWRQGRVTEITFPDKTKLRLAPELNAGSVAMLYLFSQLYNQANLAGILYGPDGIMQTYEKMFGSPWLRAQSVEPLFPATLTQPPLELPFAPGRTWSFTGGPHSAWGPDGARAAIDLAPMTTVHGCYKSDEWVTAMAAGMVVRSEHGVVVLDLDGDGYEQTGWSIMYLHIATEDRAPVGKWLNLNDPVGHPSCEGGEATGTHTHVARKYNGEWIQADGPLPFNLSGWICHAGAELYQGWMTKGDQKITSSLVGEYFSLITRPKQ